MGKNQLEQLKEMTTVVADTGEFEQIKQYKPQEATTNPSLILAAAKNSTYHPLIKEVLQKAKERGGKKKEILSYALDLMCVRFGIEILQIVPGRVSTEIDARLSFDSKKSIQKAREIIEMYEKAGVKKERILIKLASTFEGIKTAAILEKEGIHCNMTLIFSLAQSIRAALAKVTLISPFVGRILDWYSKKEGKSSYPAAEDPGVVSVKEIYSYFKKFNYPTQIMGASFRNVGEIQELAGCDLLTIAPTLLEKLSQDYSPLVRKLSAQEAAKQKIKKQNMQEKQFRWALCQHPLAEEKLREGILGFAKASEELEQLLMQWL